MSNFGKFLKGAVKFRQTIRPSTVKKLQEVKAHGHAAAVMYSCMDARLKPLSLFGADLGDIYICRNAGNFIPIGGCGHEVSPIAEPAGLDLTIKLGKIKNVIVCGHSDCAAMRALYDLHKNPDKFNISSPLHHWLEQRGHLTLQKFDKRIKEGSKYKLKFVETHPNFSFDAVIDQEEKYIPQDKLSQINTLQQIENITSHNFLADILEEKNVNLHALWFELETGNLHIFSKAKEQFVVIDEKNVNELIDEVEGRS